jgi:very-short-patch-repair endonuclease
MNESYVVALYEKEGKSTYEIAEDVGTYPNKIRRILKKHGVEMKTRSQAQKNALQGGRATHPTDGKTRTKRERVQISASVHRYWENMSEKEKKRRVKGAKDRWNALSVSERERISKMAMKAIQLAGREGSKLEKFLRQELTNAGYHVQFHKKNLIPNENMEIDLFIPDLKTIIEVDGPSHFLPIWGEGRLQKQIKADAQKTGLILSKGYVIIRVKSMGEFISLNKKESLLVDMLERLSSIEKKFPPQPYRHLEIEL